MESTGPARSSASRFIAPLAAALLAGVGAAQGATLESATFRASLTTFGTTVGPFDGTPNIPGPCDIYGAAGGCDLNGVADPNDPFSPQLVVDWVDGDSFDLFFYAPSSIEDDVPVSFSVTGLSFRDGGRAAAIRGFTFNRSASTLDTYLQSPSNPSGAYFLPPTTSWAADSVTADFAMFHGQLINDGPRLRFDVEATPVPVPLPAAGLLLIGGLLTLGGLRRFG
ncbi:hypothetical protein [Amaricoccus sp.]|uniref:hypothetical protein n=1 Tax=Amaricoccus sp. TaxID=1872485 RepID=UPI001B6F39D5|nr:hypothetical protein [Amaricoccus sp.]MBP7001205.1 hypothetical protein [Amaricoccus sp.]